MKQPHGRLVFVVVGLLSAAAGPAAAQDAPASDQPATGPQGQPAATSTEPLPPPPPPPPLKRWASDHMWVSVGLIQPMVSVEATSGGGAFAMDATGAVWRSRDGRSWRMVLEAREFDTTVDEEALLIEAEATYSELVDVEDTVDLDEDVDTTDISGDVVAEQPGSEAAGDTDIALVYSEDGSDGRPAETGGLWVDPADPRTVMAGRSDGLWVSRDGGGRWRKLAELSSVRAWLPVGSDLLVGTADGLYRSEDGGRRWQRVFPGVGSKRVHALVDAGQALLAATDQGLFLSVDGSHWRQAQGTDALAVTDVLVDPNWDGGLWLATSKGLLRSDDLAQSARFSSRNPMRGVRRLEHLDRPGHLLAVGADGSWESVDGGTTWAPLNLGVGEPDQRELAVLDGTVLLASANGLWRLERAPETPEEAEDEAQGLLLPPLDEVVDRALQRPGLRTADMTVGKAVILSRFTPNLRALIRYDPDFNRDTDYLSSFTRETLGSAWLVEVGMCWGLCGSSVDVYVDYDDYTVDLDMPGSELAVVGGQVYDFSEDTAIPAAAANVASKAVQYRTAVADIVSKAWFRRRQLALDSERVAQLPLVDQLEHHLEVLEQDARLDLYTDGWYGRAAAALASSQSDTTTNP